MQSLGIVILLAAAASAIPIADRHFFRCFPFSEHHERAYLCDSYDGRRYLVTDDSYFDDFESPRFDRSIPLLGALGGGASGAASQASAGSLSAGIGGGILPFSLSGSVSGAQSTAGAASGGGVLGLLG